MDKKKQRGQRRKIKALCDKIDKWVPFQEQAQECEYFHAPCSPWIESPKTSRKIKTKFMKKWLDKTAEIMKNKPQELPFCKVVAVVDCPNLWSSQIIIFYSEDYYKTFWDRKGQYQSWDYIDNKEWSLLKSRNIESMLTEKGYDETIIDEGATIKSALWFYGEL